MVHLFKFSTTNRPLIVACLSGLLLGLASMDTAGADDWQPAKGPLTTRWGKNVTPQNVHREYPRPQLVRPRWLNLNGVWQLDTKSADVQPPQGTLPSPGTELGEKILVPFPIESALSGVMKRTERAWYRRTFSVPKSWDGERVILHFEAVDWEAEVFVNGKRVGLHRGGYDPFSFDISDALVDGDKQELTVRVFDPSSSGSQPRGKQINKPHGIYYTPSTGIWRTVWLEPVPAAHVERLLIEPDVDGGCLRLTVKGKGTDKAKYTVEAVASEGGREIAAVVGRVDSEIRLPIPKDKIKLWSPDSPTLYGLQVKLRKDGKIIDQVDSYFAMRTSSLGKDAKGRTRMLVNGQPIFQVGTLDQGFWPDGLNTPPSDEAMRYDLEVTKRLGYNMVRKHVKVEPRRWYYWCDKLGLLVWQDMPSGDNKTPASKKQFERELLRMIQGLRNHPSIVVWVVFNEGWGQHDTPRYTDLVKRTDPSRLTINASGWTDKKVGDIHDIHCYPGPAAPPLEERRAIVLGEFGGLGLPTPGHMWTKKNWGYRKMASKDELTDRYAILLRKAWQLCEEQGLSAIVYTQTTDVETECNGLMTYDREILKMDEQNLKDANQGRVPKLVPLVPTAEDARNKGKAAPIWRYSTHKPADDWSQPEFDDTTWKTGPAGFGTDGKRSAVATITGTQWKSPEIWIRRAFELPEVKGKRLYLSLHHDDECEVYINGVLAAKLKGFTRSYEEVPISPAAAATLTTGKNTFAVHCRQDRGDQFVDVGIVEVVPR